MKLEKSRKVLVFYCETLWKIFRDSFLHSTTTMSEAFPFLKTGSCPVGNKNVIDRGPPLNYRIAKMLCNRIF